MFNKLKEMMFLFLVFAAFPVLVLSPIIFSEILSLAFPDRSPNFYMDVDANVRLEIPKGFVMVDNFKAGEKVAFQSSVPGSVAICFLFIDYNNNLNSNIDFYSLSEDDVKYSSMILSMDRIVKIKDSGGDFDIFSAKKMNVSGVSAILFESRIENKNLNAKEVSLIVIRNKFIYRVSCLDDDDMYNSSFKSFMKIISSFRFLNS